MDISYTYRCVFGIVTLFFLFSCSDSRELNLNPSKRTDGEFGFKGTLLEYNEAGAANTLRFFEDLRRISNVYKDITPKTVDETKNLLDSMDLNGELADTMFSDIEAYLQARNTMEEDWVEYYTNAQEKYRLVIEKIQKERNKTQSLLDEYYEIVKLEKAAYDEVVASIETSKTNMDTLASETVTFVNNKIVEEQIATGKIDQGMAMNALKKARYDEPGSQGYELGAKRVELYCPRNPNKKPVSVKRRVSYQYCERGGLVTLDGVEAFFTIDVIGGMSMDGVKFTESGAKNWQHLANITKKFKANSSRLESGTSWVKGGDLYESRKIATKAYIDKAQIALNTLSMQYRRNDILNRGAYVYEIKKHDEAILKNQSLLEKSDDETAKARFFNSKLSDQNRQVRDSAADLVNTSFANFIDDLSHGTEFEIGDKINIKDDTSYVVLVGEILVPAEMNVPNIAVSMTTYLVPKDDGNDKLISLDFDRFQQTNDKKSWLSIFLQEYAKHKEKA